MIQASVFRNVTVKFVNFRKLLSPQRNTNERNLFPCSLTRLFSYFMSVFFTFDPVDVFCLLHFRSCCCFHYNKVMIQASVFRNMMVKFVNFCKLLSPQRNTNKRNLFPYSLTRLFSYFMSVFFTFDPVDVFCLLHFRSCCCFHYNKVMIQASVFRNMTVKFINFRKLLSSQRNTNERNIFPYSRTRLFSYFMSV